MLISEENSIEPRKFLKDTMDCNLDQHYADKRSVTIDKIF